MIPGNNWMSTGGMPPLGFGVIMPQPGCGSVGNSGLVPPGQMQSTVAQVQLPVAGQDYPGAPCQFQQFGISQMNRTTQSMYPQQQPPPKGLLPQHLEEEKWVKRQQFDQQRQRLKEFESRKKKGSVTADSMIQDIFNRERQHYSPHQIPSTKEPERSKASGAPGLAAPLESSGGVFPPLVLPQWLEDPMRVPHIYQAAAELGGAGPGAAWVDTGKAHSLLLCTGLPPPILGLLWEAVNRTSPGQLLVTEFWALLALVACTQQGYHMGGPDPCPFLAALPEPLIPIIDHPSLCVETPGEAAKAPEEPSTVPFMVLPTAVSIPAEPRDPWKLPGPPTHPTLIRNLPTLGTSPPGTRAVSPPPFQGCQASQDDDFADFQSAAPPPPSEGDSADRYAAFLDLPPSLITPPVLSFLGEGVGGSSESSTYITASASADTSNDDEDDDFGEFVGPEPPTTPIEGSNLALETQSVASLELHGLELTVNLDTVVSPVAVQPCPPVGIHTTIKLEDAGGDMDLESEFRSLRLETPAFADPGARLSDDRYGSIRAEDLAGVTTSREVELWRRGLEGCQRLLEEGASLISPLGTDPTLLKQVVATSQMQDYLTDLGQVWCVCVRIEASHRGFSGSSSDLNDLIAALRRSWDKIKVTLGDFVHKVESSGEMSVEAHEEKLGDFHASESCGVCLNSSGDASLLYGGRSYHPPCANLWLNVVDLTLPAPSRTRPTLL